MEARTKQMIKLAMDGDASIRSDVAEAAMEMLGVGIKKGSVEGLLSVARACAYLSISRATLYRLKKDKEIPFIKIRGRKVFAIEDLKKFIAKQRSDAA